MPDIRRIISVRQLLHIGKIARHSAEQMSSKLLACWVENKRKPGEVLFNNRNSIVQNFQLLLLGEVDKFGSLKSWAFHDVDKNALDIIHSKVEAIMNGDECTSPRPRPPTEHSFPNTPPPVPPSLRRNTNNNRICSNMTNSLEFWDSENGTMLKREM